MPTSFFNWLFALVLARRVTATPPAAQIVVTVETLGREHAGKSAARLMVAKVVQKGPQESGLELTSPDPRALVKLVNVATATYQGLQKAGMIATLEAEQMLCHLCEADRLRAVLRQRDSIGHLLSFGEGSNDKRFEEQLVRHHENLTAADVIHVFVSCPPDDRPETLEQFENELGLLTNNLRVALNHRRTVRKLAVAVILSKPDGVYGSAEEAKAALPDDRLRDLFRRLVLLLEGSERVGLAAVFVVSAFGYGKARLQEQTGQATGAQAGHSLFSRLDRKHILKENAQPDPHNLTALVWWSLMAGLALKPAGAQGPEIARTAKMLLSDLKAMGGWYMPLQCLPTRG